MWAEEEVLVQGSRPRHPRAGRAAVPPLVDAPAPAPDVDSGAPGTVLDVPALPAPRPAPLVPAATVRPALPAHPPALPSQFVPGIRAGLRSRPPAPDTVVFTAACPACGEDCVWSEEREDTRLRARVTCPCAG
jgi:hypothetical protein